ncbi:hypothetical protein MIMGU_mgv1a0161582mg, partial [Erythranthe guttata]
MGWGRKRR